MRKWLHAFFLLLATMVVVARVDPAFAQDKSQAPPPGPSAADFATLQGSVDKIKADYKATVGIRVSPEEEREGLDIGEHGNEAYHGFVISDIGLSEHAPVMTSTAVPHAPAKV